MRVLGIEDYLRMRISNGFCFQRLNSYLKGMLVFIVAGAGLALCGSVIGGALKLQSSCSLPLLLG